jgi:hypothetical protein
MNTEIVAYKSTEAVIADLAARYKDAVFDVTAPDGMAQAKAAYKDINSHSITLENARVAEKATSLAYGKFVDSEAKRIAEKLDALRLPIKSQIETETKRAEREREEKVQAEISRIAAEEKARKDAEEARMAAERAEIVRQQEAIRKAEADSRAKIEAEERAARMVREEADRIARQTREAEEAKAKAGRDAEEARLRAEREALDRAKREQEEKDRAARLAKEQVEATARLAQEAKERAERKAANDLTDARGMLASFVERYGKLREFADVVRAIQTYQKRKAA